jgi:hypothetical protein
MITNRASNAAVSGMTASHRRAWVIGVLEPAAREAIVPMMSGPAAAKTLPKLKQNPDAMPRSLVGNNSGR